MWADRAWANSDPPFAHIRPPGEQGLSRRLIARRWSITQHGGDPGNWWSLRPCPCCIIGVPTGSCALLRVRVRAGRSLLNPPPVDSSWSHPDRGVPIQRVRDKSDATSWFRRRNKRILELASSIWSRLPGPPPLGEDQMSRCAGSAIEHFSRHKFSRFRPWPRRIDSSSKMPDGHLFDALNETNRLIDWPLPLPMNKERLGRL